MKKILLLVDALNIKSGTLDFAAYVAKLEKSKLVGVFVENDLLDITPSVRSLGGQIYIEEVTLSAEARKQRELIRQKNMQLFTDGCLAREVNSSVREQVGNSLKNIVHETRYADLLILDPAISFANDKTIPSRFALDLLAHAECPVLISPEYFEEPEEVVLAYDGSRSSVFAIKQFYYQLPELAGKKIIVLHVKENQTGKDHARDAAAFNEWLQMHFPNVSFVESAGDARDELFKFFIENGERYNKLLVTGAFGRNVLSSFFKPSTADLVLKAVDIPIFVAHH